MYLHICLGIIRRVFPCCGNPQANPFVAEEKADAFFPTPGYVLRDSAALQNCKIFQQQDLGWPFILLLGSCLAGGEGEENQSQPNSTWCMGTSSRMLVFVCCVQQTRAQGSGLLLLWQGAGRLHGAMPRTWGLCSVQRLDLHVMMKPEAVFKNPERQNIIRSQQ